MIEVINLASTNHNAVISDVNKIIPNWNEENVILFVNDNLKISDNGIGTRIDICKIPDRILEYAEFDEDGNLTKDAVLAGEYRVDIIPSEPVKLPEFGTQVFPENPDMEYQ